MTTTNQELIIAALKAQPEINVEDEIRRRVEFLKDYLVKSGANGYVLGISGGQDSTLCGKLAQMAIEELRNEQKEKDYQFIAMRLPYGAQLDEEDAQDALKFIQPTKSITVNIKPAVDAAVRSVQEATGESLSFFNQGNTKARERMKSQYDVGAHYGCLVIGTDHAAEAITGFFTKFGDGACDIAPLFGLTKRQGKALLKELGAPDHLYTKAPTADLEDDKPGIPDEVALGMTYDQLDDYLEGKEVEVEIAERIESRYFKTEHKRQQPVTIADSWWK
ncbi:NAD synthetase [Alkalihalobacillus alcalophilus ATCC 27647 = CGMCC 1.3604]|uniref:NH(3)-dependent NAD(+) synthetase n=1 Tax=Alkalihalobacillus alcalophilus ATCC 27647 = CGMCC 1.3604 TaxID=1218173 RepID=A0A094XET9_ALKAL|nr:ammonia-dependent NAD(+) synthetase [Alkalihalobacillus alcalophilus]KGA97265.1 NAD synthetase [Alkalihalobacillus alcalophilus ATCC 27647 = CGMCC 1.3604]MED1562786.1 ammonia-dependent NAD(+) synthetase [Alkalihalobacillus alcalophilus]THG91528.1 NAD synthetase [Alkalihalobacillus alcalophilus ATCC 27647 = CGMCC 1.3604]